MAANLRETEINTCVFLLDYFTGLVNILTDIIWRFTGDFMAPDLVCRVVRYLQVVLLYASTYVLVSLSIDRYHAIVYPMKFLQGAEKQAKVLVLIAWSLSFLFSIPTLIIFGKRKLSNGEVQCWALWPDDSYWTPYMTTVAFLVYFIPLAIIRVENYQPFNITFGLFCSVIYAIVIRTIWTKSRAHDMVISNCSGKGRGPLDLVTLCQQSPSEQPLSQDPGHPSLSGLAKKHHGGPWDDKRSTLDFVYAMQPPSTASEDSSLLRSELVFVSLISSHPACGEYGKLCTSYNRGPISKAKIKAVKYSIVIILAFICCWSPYFLFDILDNFSLLPDTEERFYASVIIQNLPALNSAINPLIYCVFSGSICFPCGEQTPRGSRMTCREKTEKQEMQVLSKPEFI
ncbi:hypothetical protein MC885_013033 [Smutsia gigantea]|nr:hypothetical protein MC885_013033 [Smutsia gigantea]